jgi:hypothetical protein
MPHRNRVTPEGEIVAVAARGTILGNRGGCFHRDDQTLKARPFASKQWICCVLQFKGRRRQLLQPGLYTELFFLDEATAMAAGHRPCFECRRADAERFAILFNEVRGKPGRAAAPHMDDVLQAERIDADYSKLVSRATIGSLADGTFVRTSNGPALLWGGQLWPWSFAGYGASQHAPADRLVDVLTPPSIVAILAAGFRPKVHETLNAAIASPII